MKVQYKWLALSATSLGLLLGIMTGTALLIALPNIAEGLNAPMITIIWVLMSYMLATTVLVPSIGRVADMIGRKRLFVLGAAIFTIASLFAGLSQSGVELLVMRIIQAIGGSLIMANSTAIVTDAFPKGELGMALGINGMVLAVGSAFGPIIGGLLTTAIGWRWIFYMNVPFGALVTIWAWIQIKDIAPIPKGEKFDWLGAISFTSGLFFLLYALTEGGFGGWTSPIVITFFILAAILIPLFVYIESKVKYPMLDLRLFKTRVQAFAYSSNLMNGISRGALMFLLIFYLLGIKNMDPFTASIYLIPFAVAMMIMAPISGRLSDRYGSRILSTLGLLITGVGLLGFAIFTRVDMSIAEVIIWGTVVGFGSGMFNSPNTNTIMSMVPPDRRGIAAGTRTMMNNAGSLVSIAMAFAILSSGLTPQAMDALFIGAQIGGKGIFVDTFISDLRLAFFISFIISIGAAVISYMRGPTPVWKDASSSNLSREHAK
ncbi:MAG: MFS transporter [Mesoaciditoga sp.]|uniref:MFS transporter n=1 Tax=Athalassotoga sp. TaxID=2022597 RepID=UPI000CB48203|nr:MAG: MFS transporter [Mesoaciditoga sp.]PMP80437.1 MAG: MFS transporter [Mesoaciditoga sp.]HEU23524.1 DHA2 family efflux MFS transporter permease subunit [Mesoaciditoga lauensis]